jgi:hypothetical protein
MDGGLTKVTTPLFKSVPLASEDYFRAVVLYGRNVASYKFALAESLISISQEGKDSATLAELALPFSEALCRHLALQDKQTTSRTSSFLDTLRRFNRGEIDLEERLDSTVRLGFVNVIDAFHVVGSGEVPVRLFQDDRQSSQPGIRLTDDLMAMAAGSTLDDLSKENESRWRLVETAWAHNISQGLMTVDVDPKLESLFVTGSRDRRKGVTSVRDALNGYQSGRCFYCSNDIYLEDWSLLAQRGEVDHFFPHVLQRRKNIGVNLDQVWNLVLACNRCNGAAGKSDSCPDISYVERLYCRNEYLIRSYKPLRESIIARSGGTASVRREFLQDCYEVAKRSLIHSWRWDEGED